MNPQTEKHTPMELRPCPIHGTMPIKSSISSEYVACERCGNSREPRELWYRPVDQWNSAWCWKQHASDQEKIRVLVEEAEQALLWLTGKQKGGKYSTNFDMIEALEKAVRFAGEK